MKIKKTLFYLVIILFVLLIYKVTKTNKINYVVIGDSISESRNSFNQIQYGYHNYIADYLEKKNKLKTYLNFSKSNYNVQNLIDDIENNKEFIINNKKENIKRALRESDFVTITIGMLDISQMVYNYSNKLDYDDFYYESNNFLRRIVDMIVSVKKYAKNEIVVIGIYNPFEYGELNNNIDKIISEINEKYKLVCEENSIVYLDVYEFFKKSNDYFSNKNSINVSSIGQKEIYYRIKLMLSL